MIIIGCVNDGYLTGIPRILYELIISIILSKFRKNVWIRRSYICNIILSMKDDNPFIIKNKYQLNGNLSHLCKCVTDIKSNRLLFRKIYNKKLNRCIWYFSWYEKR